MTANLHSPTYHSADALTSCGDAISVRFGEKGGGHISLLFDNHKAALRELQAAIVAVEGLIPPPPVPASREATAYGTCSGLEGRCALRPDHEGECVPF